MLTQELLVEIHVLHRQGKSIRAIAKALQVSRNSVRKYLRNIAMTPTYSKRVLIEHQNLIPSRFILKRVLMQPSRTGFRPRCFFAKYRPKGMKARRVFSRIISGPFKITRNEPIRRFETPAGQQLQVDFTTIRRGRHKLKAFVATLGFSRATYVRFSEYERQEDWLAGIEGALHYFGGVPKELLFDNAKCIRIERNAYGEGLHRWNARLLEMAKDYGFSLKACRPYRAKTKGKVERFNGYLKHSFITPLAATLRQAGLELDVAAANAQVGPWLHDVANQRIHATTGEQPQLLLDKERFELQALPDGVACRLTSTSQAQRHAMPLESLQHPLSVYDQLLEVRP